MAGHHHPEGRPRPALRRLERAAVLALGLAVAGETGHLALERWGADLAHHAFHIMFGFGAFGLFATFVALDIRRYGLPTFSWRIRRRP